MKTPRLTKGARTEGFTLIELLVVISIIAILAGLAMPVFSTALKKGRITDSLSNCKQINIALRMYAGDNDGTYPGTEVPTGTTAGTPLTNGSFSNKAFGNLMPRYSSSKKIFATKTSKYCKSTNTPASTAANSSQLLAGDNDWLYVIADTGTGLTETSDARWPLIGTATKSASDLTYTSITTDFGGVWGGTDAIIGYCDGSVRPASGKDMDTSDLKKTFVKNPFVPTDSIFKGSDDWLGSKAIVLAPEPGT